MSQGKLEEDISLVGQLVSPNGAKPSKQGIKK